MKTPRHCLLEWPGHSAIVWKTTTAKTCFLGEVDCGEYCSNIVPQMGPYIVDVHREHIIDIVVDEIVFVIFLIV